MKVTPDGAVRVTRLDSGIWVPQVKGDAFPPGEGDHILGAHSPASPCPTTHHVDDGNSQ